MRRAHTSLSRYLFLIFFVKAAALTTGRTPMSDMLVVIIGDLDAAATSDLPCASPKGDDR
ncbi:hypothetical protein CH294_18005 [Rhodococcus sp. 14-2483-1-1]|nr:hypothetical protein CH305_17020 [Rhodococcus sp. 15-649-2-2]OZF33025.1 hypothetical protein CH294_18005 [Rhodococcus sp. 14-2483-1-1]